MKNKASMVMMQIISALGSLIKAKSLALKTKSSAMKARVIVFALLRNKKLLLPDISHKLHGLLGHVKRGSSSSGGGEGEMGGEGEQGEVGEKKAVGKSKRFFLPAAAISHKIVALLRQHGHREGEGEMAVVPCSPAAEDGGDCAGDGGDEEEDKYPDLTHCLFDELDLDDGTGSVVELVRKTREEDFNLEDEIDHVADVFIRRFHRQIQMQKLESFKRYTDMLERSV